MCAMGACEYYSNRVDGLTEEEASEHGLGPAAGDTFEAWLLPALDLRTKRGT